MKQNHRIAIFLAALVLTGRNGFLQATENIADSKQLECAVCHDPPDSDLLTDRGKYYELMRSLDGFELVIDKFGDCTYCHAREPGSNELTHNGTRIRWMMADMKGLCAWLEEYHPRKPHEDQPEASDKKDKDGDEAGKTPPEGPLD